jgi:superfamily I DNA/RNA helicase
MSEAKVYATIGPPGTGKTTTLSAKASEAARKYGSSGVLITSLTKAAAVEAAGRKIPIPKDRIGTLHAHAYAALGCPDIADTAENLNTFGELFPIYEMTPSGGFDIGDSPDEITRSRSLGDDLLSAYQLARAKLQPRESWSGELTRFADNWEQYKDDNNFMDFEDLIENAANDVVHAPGNPYIIYGDEAQDWSPSEYKLCLRWAKEANSLVLFGDWDQALYVWRGSDPNLLKTLEVPEDRKRVLTQSYRVPRKVHALAQKWIRKVSNREDVDYEPRDEEGEVRKLHVTYRFPRRIVDDCRRYLDDGKTVMFLASCSFMLKPLINELRDAGMPFHNPYRKKNGLWNPMRGVQRVLEFLRPDEATHGDKARSWTFPELWKWIEIVSAKHMIHGMKSSIMKHAADPKFAHLHLGDNIEDAIDSANCLFKDGVDWWGGGTPAGLMNVVMGSKKRLVHYANRISKMHGNKALTEKPKIIVSTVHGVKGSEADVVFVFPDLSPNAYAEYDGYGEGRNEVLRLFYVAITRARESVVLLAPTNRFAVEW